MNSVIQPYVEGVQPPLSFGLFDLRTVPEARRRFLRGPVCNLEQVNHVYVPSGCYPARAWVLMARGEFSQLNTYATNLQLELGDSTQSGNTGVLSGWAIVQAQNVTRGLAASETDLYLVELTDARGVLRNQWFRFPLVAQYNVRAPAYPDTYMPASMNWTGSGYTTWTWETMLENIWNTMSDFLGVWPGFPEGYTVSDTPSGFSFVGVPAWSTLCDILEHIGLTVAHDPTNLVAPYTVVNPGATDQTFLNLLASGFALEDDEEWLDYGAARVPGVVVVLFSRRNDVYGTEEQVTYGQYVGNVKTEPFQWMMDSVYSVTVNAPPQFLGAVGTHYIWTEGTVRYDMDNVPYPSDVTNANNVAAERAAQYFAKIYRQTLGRMSQTYAGALPFTTGSMVDGVCWWQHEQAWKTRIVRGMEPPFDVCCGSSSREGSGY